MLVLGEVFGQLSSKRCLTCTLQTSQHDDGRWLLGELKTTLCTTEDGDELFVHDLNNLLGRVQCLVDLVAEGTFTNIVRELLDHIERDVGVQHGATNLAQSAVYIRGGKFSLTAEVFEGLSKTRGECAEGCHNPSSLANELGCEGVWREAHEVIDAFTITHEFHRDTGSLLHSQHKTTLGRSI